MSMPRECGVVDSICFRNGYETPVAVLVNMGAYNEWIGIGFRRKLLVTSSIIRTTAGYTNCSNSDSSNIAIQVELGAIVHPSHLLASEIAFRSRLLALGFRVSPAKI